MYPEIRPNSAITALNFRAIKGFIARRKRKKFVAWLHGALEALSFIVPLATDSNPDRVDQFLRVSYKNLVPLIWFYIEKCQRNTQHRI